MATFRLIFRVSKIQQYSDNYVQELLRTGLSSAMLDPLEVPEFGEINTIILLGIETVVRSVNCGPMALIKEATKYCSVSNLNLPHSRSQWEVILRDWRWQYG